jgi:hypothetical protein
MVGMAMAASGQPWELPSWQQLCDRGTNLVLCLGFATTPASTAFATLASSALVEACMLHIGQSVFSPQTGSFGRLRTQARHWVREVLETGRPVSTVLGHGAGSALATAVADAIAEAGRTPPAVVLFDATTATGAELTDAADSPAHLAYLLLAAQGNLGTRTGSPLFLSSRDHDPHHERNISLDVGRAELLDDPEVVKLVADLLGGEQSWSN